MAVQNPEGGGADPYAPDFTNVQVVPADLTEFADLLDSDLKAIRDAWERLRGDLASQEDPNFPGRYRAVINDADGYAEVYGSDGIYEAREFNRAYIRTVGAEQRLMEDLLKGLEAQRDAARIIHDGYIASDAANTDDLEGAFAAYEPSAVLDALGEADPQTKGGDPDGSA